MKTFTKKEVISIAIAILIFWFIIGISYNQESEALRFEFNLTFLVISTIIILTNILTKKIIAPRYSAKISHSIWRWKRYWFAKKSHLKKSIPFGIIFPLLISIISLGIFKPMIFLQYETENLTQRRLLKKQGSVRAQRKSELNESDMAFISAYGFYSLLFLAIIGIITKNYFNIQEGITLARYSIFYGAWNLIPFSKLDGAKTFYGSPLTYFFLLIFYIIAVISAFII